MASYIFFRLIKQGCGFEGPTEGDGGGMQKAGGGGSGTVTEMSLLILCLKSAGGQAGGQTLL